MSPRRKPKKKLPKKELPAAARLIPPPGGAVVRMYRIGHGDCFLLAFAGEQEDKPVYVLLDCGYKPGSPGYINTTARQITDNLRAATGGHIDVAVITHEHQDHVNGITAAHFQGITIGESWFAWTEDPEDDVANALREKCKDQLLGLVAARNRLQAAGDAAQAQRIDEFLAFEVGSTDEVLNASLLGAAAKDPAKSQNKQAMKLFKDRAERGPQYLRPHEEIRTIAGAKNLRVFVLGPPRDPEQLELLNPEGDEQFREMSLVAGRSACFFADAAQAAESGSRPFVPFAPRYNLPWQTARDPQTPWGRFLIEHYGLEGHSSAHGGSEAPSDADWRRIDNDWLYSAEQLALAINDQTNNTCLVLAFELSKGGKVLLFAADAQRGNWLSWAKKSWRDGSERVRPRDLLARTVLYKVGHHGSHNATLNGAATDEHANLSWMGEGEYGREFTAMIPAVRAWAETQKGWDHPKKAIKDALLRKASGRVLQTDTDLDEMAPTNEDRKVDWKAFLARTRGDRLYFDYDITP